MRQLAQFNLVKNAFGNNAMQKNAANRNLPFAVVTKPDQWLPRCVSFELGCCYVSILMVASNCWDISRNYLSLRARFELPAPPVPTLH